MSTWKTSHQKITTAIVEPTVLDTNVSSKKKPVKLFYTIRGMENPNNACYANSVFQCFINIRLIKESVLNDQNRRRRREEQEKM